MVSAGYNGASVKSSGQDIILILAFVAGLIVVFYWLIKQETGNLIGGAADAVTKTAKDITDIFTGGASKLAAIPGDVAVQWFGGQEGKDTSTYGQTAWIDYEGSQRVRDILYPDLNIPIEALPWIAIPQRTLEEVAAASPAVYGTPNAPDSGVNAVTQSDLDAIAARWYV